MAVFDASAIVPIFTAHPLSSKVLEKIEATEEMAVPTLTFVEIANAIWKYRKAGYPVSVATDKLANVINGLADVVVPVENLVSDALKIAIAENHPVSDCIYLALALQMRTPLITADKRLAKIAETLSIETILVTQSS